MYYFMMVGALIVVIGLFIFLKKRGG